MSSIRSALENTISISLFNRGLAGKIFDEANDVRLLHTATERMSHFEPEKLITQAQLDQELGFSPSDHENTDDISFE